MGIDLKRFVDVNIKAHVPTAVVGTRSTIVLFTAEGTSSTPIEVSSYSEAESLLTSMTTTLAYLDVFFKNGGVKARIIGQTQLQGLGDAISALDNKYICIAYAALNANVATTYTALKEIAVAREASSSIYGINEKIIVSRTNNKTDADSVKNFAVKYSTILGAEMTIAAYLSNVNVYRTDSVHDYMFTHENLTAEELTDTDYETCMTNNMNVDIMLAGAVRDCGGNCKNGADLINSFCLIVLHQTLTEQLIILLAQKIKNASGLSKIYAVMSQELSRYTTSGYLTTDKIWLDDDMTVTYNNAQYTIIEKGTALENGFLIKILPYESLSNADKALHKTPPIYVVIADQYGIRAVTINGEVI